MAASHGRQKDNRICRTNICFKALQIAHILIIDIDIYKATKITIRLNLLFQSRETLKQNTQYSSFSTTWRKLGRWRLWIQTTITRSLVGFEDGQLTFKTEDATMNNWLICKKSSIIQQIACGKIISAIENDIVISYDARHVCFIQTLDICDYFYIRVQGFQRFTG